MLVKDFTDTVKKKKALVFKRRGTIRLAAEEIGMSRDVIGRAINKGYAEEKTILKLTEYIERTYAKMTA